MFFQGHIQNGVVVFDEQVTLPEGTVVWVEAVGPCASANRTSSPIQSVRNGLPVVLAPVGTPEIDPALVRRLLQEEGF